MGCDIVLVPKVLIIDDEEDMCWALAKAMHQEGYDVSTATRGKEGLAIVQTENISLVLLDLKLPDIDGIELLKTIKNTQPQLPVIMVTGFGTLEIAISAIKEGASGYITKPFDIHELKLMVRRTLEINHLLQEVDFLRSELIKDYQDLAGISSPIRRIRQLMAKVAPTNATVLLTGESGTGKEVVAVGIHRLSPRRKNSFIPVHCPALPEHLFESELFGHEKGAFTGAAGRRMGRFELAHRGTLFLDEITEIPLSLQAKLLRAIEDKSFERLGSEKTVRVDTRIIAATNRDILKAVSEGKFREDLYYRLNVITIHLPPLRERREDIPVLSFHFLKKMTPTYRCSGISEEALALLRRYDWPGNVRELQNVIERALILCQDGEISAHHLPREITDHVYATGMPEPSSNKEFETGSLNEAEKRLIEKALTQTGGNRTKAAALLGITRSALLYRIHKYQL
jgi:two-component system NtrC family response regulator